ncbi:MAG: cyanobactin class RiPP [Spirulina sp.]
MDKKDLNPKQQKPVARPSITKPSIEGLSEETLTQGWNGVGNNLTASHSLNWEGKPFAGDNAE